MEEGSADDGYKILFGTNASVMDSLINRYKGISPAIYVNNVPVVFEVGEKCKGCYYLTSFAYSDICYNEKTLNEVMKDIKKNHSIEDILGKSTYTLEIQKDFLDNKECFQKEYKNFLDKKYKE